MKFAGQLLEIVLWSMVAARAMAVEVWDMEHMDIRINYDGQGWHMDLKHDIYGLRSADEVILLVRDGSFEDGEGARILRPEAEMFDFLGVGPLEPFWFIPSSQREWLVWPGFAAEDTDLSLMHAYAETDARVVATPARWIRIALESLRFVGDGPGQVSLWQGADNVFWSSYAEPEGGNVFFQLAGGHSHANWGFSHRGLYELTMRASLRLAADPSTAVVSPQMRLRFFVGSDVELWRLQHFSAQAIYPIVEVHEAAIRFLFRKPPDLGTDTLLVEHSTNLCDWSTVASATGNAQLIPVDANFSISLAPDGKVTFTIGEASQAGFLRLRLTGSNAKF